MRTRSVRSWAVFDWNDLRYLLAVADKGTLVGAARELGVKHTTVARRLAALEESLGAKLLRRGGEGHALTEAGREVIAVAAEVKAKAEAIQQRVAGADSRIAGLVRVTVPEPTGGYFVRRLPALRERYPDLVVDVLADLRMLDLAKGEADIAVRVNNAPGGLPPQHESDLVERKLGAASFALYASRAYLARRGTPETEAGLAEHDFIGVLGMSDRSASVAWLRETVPNARFVMRCNGFVQLLNAAIEGSGIAPLPCFLGDSEPFLVRVIPKAFPTGRLRVLVRPDLAKVPRIRATVDFIVELFRHDEALFDGSSVPERI